jgi:uncharacterized membrane protein YuzA (DUF378 family)
MENLSAMHLIGKAAWLITALASIHVGAFAVFRFNVFSYLPESMGFLFIPIHVLYLVAGIYSLVMLFMHCRCCEE